MTLRLWSIPFLLASLLLFAACTQPLPQPAATAVASATFTPTAQPAPLPSSTLQVPRPSLPPALPPVTPGTPADTQAAAIQQARADLARRLQVPIAQIEVVRLIADMFPAQNLGCPDGELTPQAGLPVEVPALQVTLSAAGKQYDYRIRLQQIVFCGEA